MITGDYSTRTTDCGPGRTMREIVNGFGEVVATVGVHVKDGAEVARMLAAAPHAVVALESVIAFCERVFPMLDDDDADLPDNREWEKILRFAQSVVARARYP